MSNIASGRKRKTFPALDAPGPELDSERPVVVASESEDSEDESDAPEAVTLTSGRTAAAARSSAIQNHRKRLIEKKKAQNKTREAFIQSAKSKALGTVPTLQEPSHPVEDSSKSESDSDETDKGPGELEGDSKLLARMQKAMQDALDEDEDEDDGESSNEGAIGASTGVAPSARLPDSIFAAAAQGHQKPERKRQKVGRERDAKSKRRRVREISAERIVSGRTVRVANSLDAPPPPPSKASRKITTSVKGGKTFRQKWKRRDALQAQVRSRAGPAQKFATAN